LEPGTLNEKISEAERRIRPHVRETPVERSVRFGRMTGCDVSFKLENLQHTGSFKARGATNKLLSLAPERREKGVVAASSGNHGLAVAWATSKLGVPCTVFVPEGASPAKVAAMREYGAEVRHHGTDAAVAEARARGRAEEDGLAYVSPYNDPEVVAGQGTIATELVKQSDGIDAVFVPVGGGGLISGVAGYLKGALGQGVHVYGCQPENSAVMYESVRAGRVLDLPSGPTLSDGTAGGLEPGTITFEPCRRYVDDWVLVSETEIREAMNLFMDAHHVMIEGAAGVSIAAFLKRRDELRGANVAVVVCGANIALGTLKDILR
jgi:threonine dehydratase